MRPSRTIAPSKNLYGDVGPAAAVGLVRLRPPAEYLFPIEEQTIERREFPRAARIALFNASVGAVQPDSALRRMQHEDQPCAELEIRLDFTLRTSRTIARRKDLDCDVGSDARTLPLLDRFLRKPSIGCVRNIR